MDRPLTFQEIILTLQDFWSKQGCLIWQPYYTQVGAGTNNPATILRVLGPEPWNVAYVEPSIRPDDGRYGENPNRLQQFYQYQVILKPDPGNPQELASQYRDLAGRMPWLNVFGGCCGSDLRHVTEIACALPGRVSPRHPRPGATRRKD